MASTKRSKKNRVYDFKVLLEPDEEAGGFVVVCPSLPGCYSEGDTIEEALANIKEAIEGILEVRREMNNPVPPPEVRFIEVAA